MWKNLSFCYQALPARKEFIYNFGFSASDPYLKLQVNVKSIDCIEEEWDIITAEKSTNQKSQQSDNQCTLGQQDIVQPQQQQFQHYQQQQIQQHQPQFGQQQQQAGKLQGLILNQVSDGICLSLNLSALISVQMSILVSTLGLISADFCTDRRGKLSLKRGKFITLNEKFIHIYKFSIHF